MRQVGRNDPCPCGSGTKHKRCGPLPRFGGVFADEAAWLDTWLVCDEPILDGRTALDVAPPARIDE